MVQTLNERAAEPVLESYSLVAPTLTEKEEREVKAELDKEGLSFQQVQDFFEKKGIRLVEGTPSIGGIRPYYAIKEERDSDGELLAFDPTVLDRYPIAILIQQWVGDNYDKQYPAKWSLQDREEFIKKHLKTPKQQFEEMLEADIPPAQEVTLQMLEKKYKEDVRSLAIVLFNRVASLEF